MLIADSQTARELAAKSHEARRRNKELRELAELEEQNKALMVPQTSSESYVDKRLTRVRAQIDMLSDMLEAEQDPQKIDRLANAITRLSGLEREYANRPLPGTLKPSSKPTQTRPRTVEPTAIPQPQTVQDNSPQGSPAQAKAVPGG